MNVDFTVRGPSITASVRGTVFEIDTVNLEVSEGTVEFAGASGAPVAVDAGGSSFADGGTGRPVSPAGAAAAALRPALPPGAEAAVPVNGAAPERDAALLPDFSVSVSF
jgi:hypothetical protein